MNLYNKLLDERNKKSLEYYYENKEYILIRQAKKNDPNYYKEWYEKNKVELLEKRRKKKNINKLKLNKVNKVNKKELSFTIFF
tara:strand:- start:1530 stop:1778 length:249 start_codon:yes stop_codon:yes gene_type:complete